MTELFYIRNRKGEYYNPKGDLWRSSVKKAKIYTNIGYAKCAITTKMEHYGHISNPNSWVIPSKQELEEYELFTDCEIVKMIIQTTEVIVWKQK